MRTCSRRLVFVLLGVVAILAVPSRTAAQSYYYSFGKYPWSVPLPVAGGYMDATNGNLHIEIPVASIPERGHVPFVAAFTYDSHIWQKGSVSGHETWQATNVPNSNGGWRLTTSAKSGPVAYLVDSGDCMYGHPVQLDYPYTIYDNFVWVAPDGRQIPFSVQTIYAPSNPCQHSVPNSAGFATDNSGYKISVSNYTTVTKVTAADGTQVYPNIEDTNGNYYSAPNSNGDVTDPLGRTPITTVVSGNTITYNVLNSTGGTSPFKVTTESIPVSTAFGQSGITECTTSCNITVVASFELPDSTSYSFTYDQGSTGAHYGTLTSMTLPTGGVINYTHSVKTDAYNDPYLFLGSYSLGSGSPWTYAPAVITSCGTTCSQKVTVTQPDTNNDQEVYTFTMYHAGMWNTEADLYTGSASSGALLKTVKTVFTTTATTVEPTQVTTTLPMPSGSLSKQIKITWDTSGFGNVMNLAEWLFQSTTFSSTADRTTSTTYLTNSNNNMVNKRTDVAVYSTLLGTLSETTTNYDEVATSSITGVINHDDTNYGTSYTPRGNPTSVVRSSEVTGVPNLKSVLAYDMTGQVTQVTDPNHNATGLSYSDIFFNDGSTQTPTTASGTTNAYVTHITPPSPFNAWSIRFGYFLGAGKIANKTDQNSASSTFDYMDGGSSDYLDRASKTVLPVGWAAFSYPTTSGYETEADKYLGITNATPGTSCSPSGNSCRQDQLIVDSFGRASTQVLVSDLEGADTVTTSHDFASRVSSVTTPNRSTSDLTYGYDTYTYDGLGRAIEVVHKDTTARHAYYGASVTSAVGGITAQLCPSSTYGYGYPTLAVDEAGMKRQAWKDGFGRTVELDEPDNLGNLTVNTCYTYDNLNNLKKITQGAQTRSYTYDGLSRVTQATTPESGTVTCSYSVSSTALCSGNPSAVCSRTDARGIKNTYTYDNLNRLTGISYSDTTPAVTYTYDAGTSQKGFRTGMTDGSGSATWTNNAMGWPTTEQRTIKVGSTNIVKTISYSYNQDGSLATVTYPSGRVITYAMSAAERLLSANDVANGIQYAATASYAPPGELNSVLYGPAGGITETAAFNSRLQITSTSAKVGSTTEQGLGFSYPTGNNGAISSITNSVTTGLGESFTYDSLDRILSAATTATTGAGCWGQSFGTTGGPPDDQWSNLTQMNATQCLMGSLSVTVNNATNQISTPYVYDASGNMTTEASPTTYTYQYDAENHLTQASGMFGGPWNYAYDGNGLRVRKSTSTTNGTLYWRSITGQTIAETDLTGSTSNAAYHEYIFFGGERIASRTGNGTVNYYYFDQVGSTVTMTDGSGTPCYQATFTPYGQEEQSTTPTCSTNYKFTGYERDSETGLDYAFDRFYNSRLGRFMTPDPLGGNLTDPQSLNRYAYVDNNPIVSSDASGMIFYPCYPDAGICSWGPGLDGCSNDPQGCTHDPGLTLDFYDYYLSCEMGDCYDLNQNQVPVQLWPGDWGTIMDNAGGPVLKVLKRSNDCSTFFNSSPLIQINNQTSQMITALGGISLGGPTTAAGFFETLDYLGPNTNDPSQPWPNNIGAMSNEGGSTVVVNGNPAGAFLHSGWTIGGFDSGSIGAQAIMILHELAHNLLLIPPDGNNSVAPPGQSGINTQTILANCLDAIKKALKDK